MTDEPRDHAESESIALLTVQRALDDNWPDGKRRAQLQRVMQGRISRLQASGFGSLDALRRSDHGRYERFLDGCVKAQRRDGMIASGQLGQSELREMKGRALGREHDATFADVATDWVTEERYP